MCENLIPYKAFIFGKLEIIQQTRNLDLKEVFCYLLGPVSWSITYSSGDMVKTTSLH